MKPQSMMYRREKIISNLLTAFILLLTILAFLPETVLAWSAIVTEQNIRDAVLGRRVFTQTELNEMDINSDGAVDAADLAKFVISTGSTTPVADFAMFSSKAKEGDGTVNIRVNFSNYFSGVLKYGVSGTAVSGADYMTLGGSINVNGIYVNIPVTIYDDAELEQAVETVELTIYYNEAEGLAYIPGPSTDHTLYIEDNDALWNGTIENNGTALHFQMKIIQSPSGTSGALVTDGYGIIPLNGNDSEWPANTMNLTQTTFNAVIDHITVPESLTLTNEILKRKFTFQADAQQPDYVVDPDAEIRGTVQEIVTCETAPQFNYTATGSFSLLRQIPTVEPQEPVLEDVN